MYGHYTVESLRNTLTSFAIEESPGLLASFNQYLLESEFPLLRDLTVDMDMEKEHYYLDLEEVTLAEVFSDDIIVPSRTLQQNLVCLNLQRNESRRNTSPSDDSGGIYLHIKIFAAWCFSC